MATNRKTSAYYSLIAATLGAGVALAIVNITGAEARKEPTPTALSSASAMVGVQEDDPGFDCNTMGNRVCGDPQGAHAVDAWEAWDSAQGWPHLRVEEGVRVEYVGTTQAVSVDPPLVSVPAMDGNRYVFLTERLDVPAAGPHHNLPL